MQYVGQTCRTLQKRFGEHYRRIRKPENNDTFLYQHLDSCMYVMLSFVLPENVSPGLNALPQTHRNTDILFSMLFSLCIPSGHMTS